MMDGWRGTGGVSPVLMNNTRSSVCDYDEACKAWVGGSELVWSWLGLAFLGCALLAV